MKRNGFAKGRGSAAGAAVGVALAVGLYLWKVVAREWFGVHVESIEAVMFLAGLFLGFPFGWLILFLVEWSGIAGVNEYLLLLSSIVANWAGLGFLWSHFRRRE